MCWKGAEPGYHRTKATIYFYIATKEVVGGRMKRKKKLYEVGCYLILKVQENKFT